MTDETPISQEPASDAAEATPRPKRSSSARPKKQAKSPKAQAPEAEPPAPAEPVASEPASKPMELPTVIETVDEPRPIRTDWPEPEPATTGGSTSGGEGGKRKRRRKKNKGGKPQEQVPQPEAEGDEEEDDESSPRPNSPQGQSQRPPQQPQNSPRPRLDSEAVAKLACKIYLAEVSEEGVALIDDGSAKELSRRCFRLAEIFLEEQSRRR